MKKITFIPTILFVLAFLNLQSKENIPLKFNKEGRFKVAQFTDLHWNPQSENCIKTIEIIQHVLTAEKPDIAILTGDVVTYIPAKEGWLSIAKIFEDHKTPFAVTLGNHDAEPDIKRDEIFDLLANLPYFVGSKGPELHGCGNYVLPIISSQEQTPAALLYCMDSNDYPSVQKYGHYDWVRFEQIDWYRKTSDEFTKENNNQTLPALAFFHIPIPEFSELAKDKNTVGIRKEGVASPRINSGLFCSMLEKKDVMGVFVGHDHNNNYIGLHYDIALAFGQVTGVDAYGAYERGARIILLQENKFAFDTWIRTLSGTDFMFFYPSGLSAKEEETANYLPAKNIKPKQQGVAYKYFEGKFKHTDQIAKSKVLKEGIMKNISIESAPAKDSFAYEFKAWIQIPEKGIYRFYTFSDDGSKLLIDGKVVVDNDGGHSNRRIDGKIALDAGFHELKLLYFEDYMGQQLEVGISSRYMREDKISDNMLFVVE